ncbi:MAG: hypothetical protein GY861_04530, partial [bacterium]|nr:hypothetical protein [bacterium]
KSAVLLSIDHIMAAFDVIEWDFIKLALQSYGLGPNFIYWFSIIYREAKSSVQVNGFISAPFGITRGICQGCPLSPSLYVLVAEAVANYIRKDPLVEGLILFGQEYKLSNFADDTNIFLSSYQSVLRVLQI